MFTTLLPCRILVGIILLVIVSVCIAYGQQALTSTISVLLED